MKFVIFTCLFCQIARFGLAINTESGAQTVMLSSDFVKKADSPCKLLVDYCVERSNEFVDSNLPIPGLVHDDHYFELKQALNFSNILLDQTRRQSYKQGECHVNSRNYGFEFRMVGVLLNYGFCYNLTISGERDGERIVSKITGAVPVSPTDDFQTHQLRFAGKTSLVQGELLIGGANFTLTNPNNGTGFLTSAPSPISTNRPTPSGASTLNVLYAYLTSCLILVLSVLNN